MWGHVSRSGTRQRCSGWGAEAGVREGCKPHGTLGGCGDPQGWVHVEEQTAKKRPSGASAARPLPGAIFPGATHCERHCYLGRNGQMLQLMLSHFTFDGRGVPNLVNCFLTIPLVTGGKTPADCKRDRAGHLITALLLCALQSPQEPERQALGSLGWCKDKAKRQSLPGKLVPVSICNSEKSTSPTKPGNGAARVLYQGGMF